MIKKFYLLLFVTIFLSVNTSSLAQNSENIKLGWGMGIYLKNNKEEIKFNWVLNYYGYDGYLYFTMDERISTQDEEKYNYKEFSKMACGHGSNSARNISAIAFCPKEDDIKNPKYLKALIESIEGCIVFKDIKIEVLLSVVFVER